ncbi:MAG TPA: ABC transporter substrate-binding protein [Candidatus Binatia bacterium]|jgi:putative ABC transport system substrate-binding protein
MNKTIYSFFAAAIFLCLALTIFAGQPPRPWKIAVLVAQAGPSEDQTVRGLRDGLKELGYKERRNVVIEINDLKGDRAALKSMATEIVGNKADLIFTTGTRATEAAIAATKQIPIVFRHPADPEVLGFVKSLKQPGGNATGVAAFSSQTTEKRLGILKEFVPNLRRVHVFYDSNNPFAKENFAAAKKTAAKLGLEVADHSIKTPDELKTALNGLQKQDGDAIFEVSDDLVESQSELIFDTARQKALPTIFEGADWAIKGAMLSYGANYYQMGRQAAGLANKIFRGARPATLPVERASKYDLLVNLRMANAIGLAIAPETLKKADKVIR